MLTRIRIQNFKLWQDSGDIRLAPITVFFGANSSGKSSLQQFLLMLKQTAASSDRSRVLHTGDASTPVDLGGFGDLVHHGDTSLPLEFELEWQPQRQPNIVNALDRSQRLIARQLTFHGEIVQEEGSSGPLRVARMGYTASDANEIAVSMAPNGARGQKYNLEFRGYSDVRNKGRAWPLPAPRRFYGFPEEAVSYYQNTAFLPDLSLALERELDGIYYLGPLRQHPERFYLWSGSTPEHVGWRGERTVEALLAGRQREFNFRWRQFTKPLDVVVARWLEQLGLIDDFDVVEIAEGRPHREVRVRVKGGRDSVLITDVGFGVSQVLPVLVQCLYADPGSTIILEQPELHLHPKVQMELADVLVAAAIRARENSAPRGIQLLIETHSEHFLRRLQRRIAEGDVRPEQIALYFCEAHEGVGTITELEVDLFGNIANWPRDFFGDQMEDVAEQAKARLRRQREAG